MKKTRGNLRCGLDGLIHVLTYTNIGDNSWGDKIMGWTMPNSGAVDESVPFASGFLAGGLAELSFGIYCFYESFNGDLRYLASNLAIKILPRVINYYNNRKLG